MSESIVTVTSLFGAETLRLQSDQLEMTVVPEWGGQVISLKSKATGIELLRTPATLEEYRKSPVLFGIPVLFPPNRIEKGTFVHQGERYQLKINEANGHHIHGCVKDVAWNWSITGAGICLSCDSTEHPSIVSQFPHHFRLDMNLSLMGAEFIQEMRITNLSTKAFPWGLGYHTTFNMPFIDNAPRDGCTLALPADLLWELDDNLLPTGTIQPYALAKNLNRGMELDQVRLDDALTLSVQARKQPNEAVLTDASAGLRIRYKADNRFKHWVLHNGHESDNFICPEPYTWVTNAPNLPLDAELTGLQVLHPGQSVTISCSIQLEMI